MQVSVNLLRSKSYLVIKSEMNFIFKQDFLNLSSLLTACNLDDMLRWYKNRKIKCHYYCITCCNPYILSRELQWYKGLCSNVWFQFEEKRTRIYPLFLDFLSISFPVFLQSWLCNEFLFFLFFILDEFIRH